MRSDLPIIDGNTEEYWAAAGRGVLLIKHCRSCGLQYFYPRPRCPECWSNDTEWVEACGRGTIYSYSVVRRQGLMPFRDKVPYVVAVVELDEGPRMSCNIVDCGPEAVRIGAEVRVTFEVRDDVHLPQFSLVELGPSGRP